MSLGKEKKRSIFIPSKQPLKHDLEEFILRWNAMYPIDRWWREKHKVAFNSPEHRVVSFLDMYIEWREDKIYNEALTKNIKNSTYKPGDWLIEQAEEKSVEEEIKEFEQMDLSRFDDKK